MIIPYNVLFKRNLDIKGRGAVSDDGSSDGGNLSPQNQAIIGAVVGGVALIAITAGILVFLIKKQKWDRIRKREEALLALHAPPPYGSDSQLRSGSRSLWSRSTPPRKSISPPLVAPRPVTLPPPAMREVEEQPPAYGTHSSFPIPIYDPSRYPLQHQYRQFRPASALTVNSGCLHYVAGDRVHGQRSSMPGSRLSLPFGIGNDQRNTMQGRIMVQGRSQAQGQAQSQALGGSRGISQPDPGSNANMNASSFSPDTAGTTRPPRKPKPALSRIITNFG